MKQDSESMFKVFADIRVSVWVEAENSEYAKKEGLELIHAALRKSMVTFPEIEDIKAVRYAEVEDQA